MAGISDLHKKWMKEPKYRKAYKRGLPPVHPGEIIKQDILPFTGLSVTAAAKALGVSRQMLHDILAERKPLSAVMCLKVSRLFGGPPELWMRLQAAYDLKKAEQDKKVMARVARIVPVKPLEEIRA
jgi:addiction module HigA family antidote